jgi:hypothetical protein
VRLVIELDSCWLRSIERCSRYARLAIGGFFGWSVDVRILGVLPDDTDTSLCVIPLERMTGDTT